MALTITPAAQNTNTSMVANSARGMKMAFGKFTPDSSWLAAGEALTFGDIGTPIHVDIESTGGIVFNYDYTNEKVLAWYCDLSASTDSALIVVPDSVNLSSICADTHYVAYGFI